MAQLVSFPSDAGPPLLVEVVDSDYGLERVAREEGGIVQATEKLDEALKQSMPSLRTVVRNIRSLTPDRAEIEFGITLTAEAGVVVAKTAVEGHFTVRLSWDSSDSEAS